MPSEPAASVAAGARARLPRAVAALALAALCLAGFRAAWAGGVAWAVADEPPHHAYYDRTLALQFAQGLATAARAVAEGAPPNGVPWEGLVRLRSLHRLADCRNGGFLDFATGGDNGACKLGVADVLVRASGPGLFEASVGPLSREGAVALARLLPRDPALKVTVPYASPGDGRAPGPGTLWMEPARLDPGQLPSPTFPEANLQVRIEPTGAKR